MPAPRILIVRLSAIGDAIQGMPIACALREGFPEAFLAWAAEERAGQLLQGHEALDQLITLPHGWLRSPRIVWSTRRLLRRLRFDVALDAQGLTKSAVLAWLSGAPRRIGFGDPWGRELSRWFNTETVDSPGLHIIDRNLQLLRPLGIESPRVRFQVPEHEADRQAAEEIIRALDLEHGFAIINPGASTRSKWWPPERYGAVARHLGKAWRLPTLVVWAEASERTMADEVAAASAGWAHVASPTTLREVAALCRRARLFIGSDTGPLHLAEAVGTPCVGLYGPWSAACHGPYGPKHIALQKMFFEGSTRARRTAPSILMESITVEMVCEACDQILERESLQAVGYEIDKGVEK